jgi:hypothetical protein
VQFRLSCSQKARFSLDANCDAIVTNPVLQKFQDADRSASKVNGALTIGNSNSIEQPICMRLNSLSLG